MSLRNNKAAQLNRHMMFGMIFLAIVVFFFVCAFLYMSASKESNLFANDKAQADSTLVIEVTGDSSYVDSLSN